MGGQNKSEIHSDQFHSTPNGSRNLNKEFPSGLLENLTGRGWRGAVDRAKGKRVAQELCWRLMPEVAYLGLTNRQKYMQKQG